MAGPHILASQYRQRQFAGNTSPTTAPPTLHPGSPFEHLPILGDLDLMLAGGFHPEMLLSGNSRAELTNVEAKLGPHGGTVTAPHSGAAPGPAGSAKRLIESTLARFR